jgi:hypothetical protein
VSQPNWIVHLDDYVHATWIGIYDPKESEEDRFWAWADRVEVDGLPGAIEVLPKQRKFVVRVHESLKVECYVRSEPSISGGPPYGMIVIDRIFPD